MPWYNIKEEVDERKEKIWKKVKRGKGLILYKMLKRPNKMSFHF